MGHEGAGIVEEVGSAVKTVQPGDHVVLSTLASCGRCSACARGLPTRCRQSIGNWTQPFTYKGQPTFNFAAATASISLTVSGTGTASASASTYTRKYSPSQYPTCLYSPGKGLYSPGRLAGVDRRARGPAGHPGARGEVGEPLAPWQYTEGPVLPPESDLGRALGQNSAG